MYCGNCFRDNALVRALRQQAHAVTMVPLYLPMTLDEEDQSAGTPIFFGGVNVYLQQKSKIFGQLPRPLHQWLSSPSVLKWASGRAAKTRADELGERDPEGRHHDRGLRLNRRRVVLSACDDDHRRPRRRVHRELQARAGHRLLPAGHGARAARSGTAARCGHDARNPKLTHVTR